MSQAPRRQHLIDTAFQLFNEHGYHATGIDRILAESGVSKATLYKHFKSKEELILAVLRQRHEQLQVSFARYMDKAAAAGGVPALAVFDALDDWFRSDSFFGCNFIRAAGEYARSDSAIYDYAAFHKKYIRSTIEKNLGCGEARTRKQLAGRIALLVDGAIVAAHTRGEKNAAREAKKTAEVIIAAAVS